MKLPRPLFALAALALAAGLASSFAGETREITLAEVPAELMEIARKLLPDVTWERADIETEEAGEVYEIIGKDANGVVTEIDIFKNGKIEEYEKVIPKEEVPGAVLKAIEAKYPSIRYELFEASYTPTHKIFQYEIVGTHNGARLDLDLSADGRKIVEADD